MSAYFKIVALSLDSPQCDIRKKINGI